jgi:hypothetical protein
MVNWQYFISILVINNTENFEFFLWLANNYVFVKIQSLYTFFCIYMYILIFIYILMNAIHLMHHDTPIFLGSAKYILNTYKVATHLTTFATNGT